MTVPVKPMRSSPRSKTYDHELKKSLPTLKDRARVGRAISRNIIGSNGSKLESGSLDPYPSPSVGSLQPPPDSPPQPEHKGRQFSLGLDLIPDTNPSRLPRQPHPEMTREELCQGCTGIIC